MKILNNPSKSEWTALCERPKIKQAELEKTVAKIFKNIEVNGDVALRYFAEKLDGNYDDDLRISEETIQIQAKKIDATLQEAIDRAFANIWKFHLAQKRNKTMVKVQEGLQCWTETKAIERVGLYVPGGSAPLFSSLMMLAIPAKIAGSKELVVCTPVRQAKELNPAIAYILTKIGSTEVYGLGGAQAIGAMALGTNTIKPVQLIAGPGNQYVTEAKMQAQRGGLAIDMPAGPSEVLVIADKNSKPDFLAADLLSQAEHGPDSQVVLCSNSKEIINQTIAALEKQVKELPRAEIAQKALENSRLIYFDSNEQSMEFSNAYAPEHLIIATEDAEVLAEQIQNAGSVFLGKYSCESAGDYASGTNHTLPTNGFAKAYSGVSVSTFQKTISFQKLESTALLELGPVIETLAAAEGLQAHKNAVTIRLNDLRNDN